MFLQNKSPSVCFDRAPQTSGPGTRRSTDLRDRTRKSTDLRDGKTLKHQQEEEVVGGGKKSEVRLWAQKEEIK